MSLNINFHRVIIIKKNIHGYPLLFRKTYLTASKTTCHLLIISSTCLAILAGNDGWMDILFIDAQP